MRKNIETGKKCEKFCYVRTCSLLFNFKFNNEASICLLFAANLLLCTADGTEYFF